ncbi:MAG: hypothetical protein COA78_09675 [Blastopirellula sp.]|nr:MAG: hypothetical protein COA78_09675 [Blastopirellula sp.]
MLGLKLSDKKTSKRTRRKSRALNFESLESKQLLAADLISVESNDNIYMAEVAPAIAGSKFVIKGNLNDDTDVDLYEVSLGPGQTLKANIEGTGSSPADTHLRLFSENGTQVAYGEKIDATTIGGGTFYIGVSQEDNVSYDATVDTSISTASEKSGHLKNKTSTD